DSPSISILTIESWNSSGLVELSQVESDESVIEPAKVAFLFRKIDVVSRIDGPTRNGTKMNFANRTLPAYHDGRSFGHGSVVPSNNAVRTINWHFARLPAVCTKTFAVGEGTDIAEKLVFHRTPTSADN